MNGPQVLIVMGSDSDVSIMEEAAKILDEFGVTWEMRVASAHRSPRKAAALASGAAARGVRAIIAGAGMAAHLAGVIAADTVLPVIAVPIPGGALNGVDALYAMVQMPAGIPVATMAIGKAGAKNAGLLAAQIIALGDSALTAKLHAHKQAMADEVEAKDGVLQQRLGRG